MHDDITPGRVLFFCGSFAMTGVVAYLSTGAYLLLIFTLICTVGFLVTLVLILHEIWKNRNSPSQTPTEPTELDPPTFEVTQNPPIPGTLKREFPDIGFNIMNPNRSPIKVKVLVKPILGEEELDPIGGHYSGEHVWNLNSISGVNGHFQVPGAENSTELLELKVTVTYIDSNDEEHELLPVGYVYRREQNDWYFNP